MLTTIESLPNEILVHIFSYLQWFDMLISFWSLNIRFDSLVCSILSINANRLNSGLVFTRGLSYKKYSMVLFPLISNSPLLASSIRRIHFDGQNSNASDLCYQLLFNHENILHFPNLKSLLLTRCESIKSIFRFLSYLIEYQLDEFKLTYADPFFSQAYYVDAESAILCDIENELNMNEELVSQLFSAQCNLKSLQFDLIHYFRSTGIRRCVTPNCSCSSNSIPDKYRSICVNLHRLHIRLIKTDVIENLVECLPNLEEMSVECLSSLHFDVSRASSLQSLRESTGNWLNKMPKLRYFSLKTLINRDAEFVYLKWLLNNLNYVEKLQIHLKGSALNQSWDKQKSFIDANFIREYCLPDRLPNLRDFNFYICFPCQLSSDDIEQTRNSFQIHPLFISHQWTTVQCLFDPIMSCEHLFSSFTSTLDISPKQKNYSFIFDWSPRFDICEYPYPLLHLFLEQFNQLSLTNSSIKIHQGYGRTWSKSDLRISSEILLQLRQYNGINFPFRHLTKIQFGVNFKRKNARTVKPQDRNPIREKVLAHLISMTVQLKCLIVEQFEWLLHVVQYSSRKPRMDALSTVRYAEFCLPYRFIGYKKTSVGKRFVSFLRTYMPHLQTLRLWRSDDFPWSLARPGYIPGYLYTVPSQPWLESETSTTIAKHVSVFEQDLSQLVQNLKDLTSLDIYGLVSSKKAQAYLSMAQTRFPQHHIYIDESRFSLWL